MSFKEVCLAFLVAALLLGGLGIFVSGELRPSMPLPLTAQEELVEPDVKTVHGADLFTYWEDYVGQQITLRGRAHLADDISTLFEVDAVTFSVEPATA